MTIYIILLTLYFYISRKYKSKKDNFLLFSSLIIILHSILLHIQYNDISGGSDEIYYIENALAINKGWEYFISFRDYLPSSYYAYSYFTYLLSIDINNPSIWLTIIRLSNVVLLSISLLPYKFKQSERGSKISKYFIFIACLWVSLFNFRDSHILALLLTLYSVNFILTLKAYQKITANFILVSLVYFYKPELYLILFCFILFRLVIKLIPPCRYLLLKSTILLMLLFLPMTIISPPAPLDYLLLRMVYNNEVDINKHTKLDYNPIEMYQSKQITVIGKTIAERAYKRFHIIFLGYNPLVMIFDYSKKYNDKFGINLTLISYTVSQILFFLYYLVLNPILIAALFLKNSPKSPHIINFFSMYLCTILFYCLYNILQGSAQPRVTIPLTCILIYLAYQADLFKVMSYKLIMTIVLIMLPVAVIHFCFYLPNILSTSPGH